MADFDGNFVQCRGDNRQGRDVVSMPVALNYLRCYRSRLQSQLLANAFFVLWAEMPERPHSAGQFADANLFRRRVEAFQVASHLRVPVEQLESESGWFRVNAVCAANRWRVLELNRPLFQYFNEPEQVF